MAGEKRRVTEAELHWQAANIGEQVKASAPEDVGFALVMFVKAKGPGNTPVAFASSAVSAQEKGELQQILRGLANQQGGLLVVGS
jgi:hypothetical protein